MNFLEKSNKLSKNIAVINDDGLEISYSQLDEFSTQLKTKLPARSVIFSLNKNTIGSIVGYYSFIKNKVIPFMLEAKMDKSLIDNLISFYNPQYIWLPTEISSNYSKSSIIYSIFDYSLIKLENNEKPKVHNDLALLLSTSGLRESLNLLY